jgi:hypothetical protein
MKKPLPTLKILLAYSVMILTSGFVSATDSAETANAAPSEMAGPGFLGRSSVGPTALALFGFGSTAYLTYPSIWGILEITDAQGKELQKAWSEILVPIQGAYGRDTDPEMTAKRPAAEAEFKKLFNELLDDHQKEARSAANQFFGNLGKEIAAQKLSGEAKKTAIEEKVQSVFRPSLTQSQQANWDAVMDAGKDCEP